MLAPWQRNFSAGGKQGNSRMIRPSRRSAITTLPEARTTAHCASLTKLVTKTAWVGVLIGSCNSFPKRQSQMANQPVDRWLFFGSKQSSRSIPINDSSLLFFNEPTTRSFFASLEKHAFQI